MKWLLMFIISAIIVRLLSYQIEERTKKEKKLSGKEYTKSNRITEILEKILCFFGFVAAFPVFYFIWYIFGGAVLIEVWDAFDTSTTIGVFIGSTICFIIVIIFIIALFSRK